jgi:hypothetical protein
MPLSTKELVRNIPREPDARNARYVHVFARKVLGVASYLFTTVTKIPGDFTRKHRIWIKDLNGKDVMSTNNVWVSCDCDRFTYAWEVALTRRGASSVRFSNGEPPVKINPRMHPAACKHVYRVLADIAQNKRKNSKKKPPL